MKDGILRRILQAFVWWEGATWGTQLATWRHGEEVGQDEFGNRYFRTRRGRIDPALGFERRWVIYRGEAEASQIPPAWYRWMHHQTPLPPTKSPYRPREWEKPHQPNQTGTPNAHVPHGSIVRPDPERAISAGYDAWTPG
jgi:NADH:ubiquinone oxidoreductase subunit